LQFLVIHREHFLFLFQVELRLARLLIELLSLLAPHLAQPPPLPPAGLLGMVWGFAREAEYRCGDQLLDASLAPRVAAIVGFAFAGNQS
jgi:hypothetical protein